MRAIPVRTVGPVAQRLLGDIADGRVVAVFGAAFYVESRSQVLCLGTSAIEAGPITLITAASRGTDWRALGLTAGEPVLLSATEIRVAGRFRFPLRGAAPWAPETISEAAKPGTVACGLAALRAATSCVHGMDGLGGFIDPGWTPDPDRSVAHAAADPVADARRWLSSAFAVLDPSRTGDLDWARQLVGLGIGLTPSGDDFLGGLMIALHALGHGGIARALWCQLGPAAREATNAISFALLAPAAEGLGSESIHMAICAVTGGDAAALRLALPGIGRIGHSSGWDAMAGVAVAMDGWLRWQAEIGESRITRRSLGPAPGSASVWSNSAHPYRPERPGKAP